MDSSLMVIFLFTVVADVFGSLRIFLAEIEELLASWRENMGPWLLFEVSRWLTSTCWQLLLKWAELWVL